MRNFKVLEVDELAARLAVYMVSMFPGEMVAPSFL